MAEAARFSRLGAPRARGPSGHVRSERNPSAATAVFGRVETSSTGGAPRPRVRGVVAAEEGTAEEGAGLAALPLGALVDRVLGRAATRRLAAFGAGDGTARSSGSENSAFAASDPAAGAEGVSCGPPTDLARLSRASLGDLVALGLAPAGAARLAAAFELGRRVEAARRPPRPALRSPERVHRLLQPQLRGLVRETFLVLLLDGKHRLERVQTVSVGTLTSSLVHPREVFAPALVARAAALIAVHNHPSGDVEPSADDLEVTRRLIAAGRLVGVPVLDHVIVTDEAYLSLRTRMDFG